MKGLFSINGKEGKKEKNSYQKIKEDTMVIKEYKLNLTLSDVVTATTNVFSKDKKCMASIVNGLTGIPEEVIIERGIFVGSEDLKNEEIINQYKDSDILISVYNGSINVLIK